MTALEKELADEDRPRVVPSFEPCTGGGRLKFKQTLGPRNDHIQSVALTWPELVALHTLLHNLIVEKIDK